MCAVGWIEDELIDLFGVDRTKTFRRRNFAICIRPVLSKIFSAYLAYELWELRLILFGSCTAALLTWYYEPKHDIAFDFE